MFFKLWWRLDNLSKNCVSFGCLNFGDYFFILKLRYIFFLFKLIRLNYLHNLFSTLSKLYTRMHRLLYLFIYLSDLRYLLLYVKLCQWFLTKVHGNYHIVWCTHWSILNTLGLFIFAAKILNEIFAVFLFIFGSGGRMVFNDDCLSFLRWYLLSILEVKAAVKCFRSIAE